MFQLMLHDVAVAVIDGGEGGPRFLRLATWSARSGMTALVPRERSSSRWALALYTLSQTVPGVSAVRAPPCCLITDPLPPRTSAPE